MFLIGMGFYSIRSAGLSDSSNIYLNVLNRVGREAYNEQLICDLIKDDLSICLVAEKGEDIVGALGARREGHEAYWLYFLHSKKEGNDEVECLLMEKFFEIVKEKNANKIASDSPDVRLLKKFGFNEVGRIPEWQKDGRDQIIMFKKLL